MTVLERNQRWRARRDLYRPPTERICTRAHDVEEIAGDRTAKAFVLEHHYSGTYPAARWRFGLYRRGELAGVAVFSHPTNNRVLTNVFPGPARSAVELGRFVLLDEVEGNGETWFLARCFELLRGRVRGVVSFSDPVPRRTASGVVFPGHVGTIYQAHNARFLGRGTATTLRLLPDGAVLSNRAISKVRKMERSRRAVVELMQRHGAGPVDLDDPEALRAWVREEVPRITTPLRHPGNYRYAWAIDRRIRRALPEGQPYPKLRAAA